MAKVTIGNSNSTTALITRPRRTQRRLMCWTQSQFSPESGPLPSGPRGAAWRRGRRGGPPPGGRPPGSGGAPRRARGGGVSSAALTSSIGARGDASERNGPDGAAEPSNPGFTASLGSPRPGNRSSVTAGRTVVSRSSGGAGRRRLDPGPPERSPRSASLERPGFACFAPRSVGVPVSSLDDWSWGPSLFTGRSGALARRPRGPGAPGRRRGACRAQHVRLDQVIPAAGPAYLHHVDRELLEKGRQHDQLLGRTGRPRHRSQVFPEYPRHERELFLAANRAHHLAGFPVVLRGPQQIRVCITNLGHAGAAGVHLGQQGTPPERVVHHLSLQSHADQSTSRPAPPTRNQGPALWTRR